MKLYIFTSTNVTNIWAGIGAKTWAVSGNVAPSTAKGRRTKAESIRVGQFGLLYLSSKKCLTTPFLFTSVPDTDKVVADIWDEKWVMPFSIYPLGNPRKTWNANEAAAKLPFNRQAKKTNLASVFNMTGLQVFTPIEISEDDWEMIVQKLSDI